MKRFVKEYKKYGEGVVRFYPEKKKQVLLQRFPSSTYLGRVLPFFDVSFLEYYHSVLTPFPFSSRVERETVRFSGKLIFFQLISLKKSRVFFFTQLNLKRLFVFLLYS